MQILADNVCDVVSRHDRYDLKANAFNTYFPKAKPIKTEQQIMEEKREALGLKRIGQDS